VDRVQEHINWPGNNENNKKMLQPLKVVYLFKNCILYVTTT